MIRFDHHRRRPQEVCIESRVNVGAWAQLGIDTQSPYVDTTALRVPGMAETCEYRASYWGKGVPN